MLLKRRFHPTKIIDTGKISSYRKTYKEDNGRGGGFSFPEYFPHGAFRLSNKFIQQLGLKELNFEMPITPFDTPLGPLQPESSNHSHMRMHAPRQFCYTQEGHRVTHLLAV